MSQQGHVILKGRAWLALPESAPVPECQPSLLNPAGLHRDPGHLAPGSPGPSEAALLRLADPSTHSQDTGVWAFPSLGFSHFEEGGWLQPGTGELPTHSHPGSLGAV